MPHAPSFLGLDVGAETLKLVEIVETEAGPRPGRRALRDHAKDPRGTLAALLAEWGLEGAACAGMAATGRLSRGIRFAASGTDASYRPLLVPMQQARARGFRFHVPEGPATLVSVGSRGFSVLELRDGGLDVYRENARCSQGTGNFLRQLVERFDLDVETAGELCARVSDPAPLSGRCPVILKTDMTHLANAGQDRARVLAGLFDAVAENLEALVKPRHAPPRALLCGGVSRSRRIQAHFASFLGRHGMSAIEMDSEDRLFLEALGCALLAAETPRPVARLGEVLLEPSRSRLEFLPPLSGSMDRVRRLPAPELQDEAPRRLVLGLDIGSTGSKLVALDPEADGGRGATRWQAYARTLGDPLGAAQGLVTRFLADALGATPAPLVGVTGSGREIVASILVSCFGSERVYMLNEIAAHAEGALHHDPRVDTIFEIGGQDAKFIRLEQGRIVEAAMNEACSAGTGSFIEEQGRRFPGLEEVSRLGPLAMRAEGSVSLGQHCSVFMAEILDEAVARGVDEARIVAGIHESVIQNYLNRVKGSRKVGQRIFCQGMPFASDALAAAVVRQTGAEIVVPPDPGTVGALGIALLARRERAGMLEATGLDLRVFLGARLEARDTFACASTKGCGEPGNRCRIERLRVEVLGTRRPFTWGGGCSLHDRGFGRVKLPPLTPDPFRGREERVAAILASLPARRGAPRVGLQGDFMLKSCLPFFATFLHGLGLDPVVSDNADQADLKRGIEEAKVPFCAPMQQYHGAVSRLAEQGLDWLFLPMIRSLPRVAEERHAVLCPIVQGSPEILRWNLGNGGHGPKLLLPVVDIGAGNWRSAEIAACCARIAADLGLRDERWRKALEDAVDAQEAFEATCLDLGREAMGFARSEGLLPVVVLGRPYTIHNRVLNSNVPAILREQGALAIPLDCWPVPPEIPIYERAFWGYEQRILRAARAIRQEQGTFSVWCSNYACGPDSFGLHFYARIMEGKPFAVIETDGHSGDGGTRTRVEAFLHCAREALRHDAGRTTAGMRVITGTVARMGLDELPSKSGAQARLPLSTLERERAELADIRRAGEIVLIPRMGPGNGVVAACLNGIGVPAEALPMPDHEALRLGRRHTSGKECVPMGITLGSLLQRLERARGTEDRFAFFMPEANGPCRFGAYNLLHKLVLDDLGWRGRVRIWSPQDNDYFRDTPPGFAAAAFCGFMAVDLLLEGLHHTRPVERAAGGALRIFQDFEARLRDTLEARCRADLSLTATARALAGDLFGCQPLLEEASRAYAALALSRELPSVLVVGEIYVRCDPFANGFVIEALESRGIRCRFAPFNEWIEYTDSLYRHRPGPGRWARVLRGKAQDWIRHASWRAMASGLGWGERTDVAHSVAAAAPYLREALRGEAVLTLGGPVHEWREGLIHGALAVNPLECMPGKLAEAQLFHVAEQEGLPSLCLSVNGEPLDEEALDSFAFRVHRVFQARARAGRGVMAGAEAWGCGVVGRA
jgi:activator of 2-hydroxyglutaryl-CoA dehydratase/predicted nucleotide-binding protein (sugar kinase/HSP70/actin superfamily)